LRELARNKFMKRYIKEYELEKQLFEEVSKNFRENKTLSEEEFFKIVIWKSNRSKGKVLDEIRKNKKSTPIPPTQ